MAHVWGQAQQDCSPLSSDQDEDEHEIMTRCQPVAPEPRRARDNTCFTTYDPNAVAKPFAPPWSTEEQQHPQSWRYQCKARNVGPGHNGDNAYIEVPANTSHGTILYCSHHGCVVSGRAFRWCAVCKTIVAKRNFIQRHRHGNRPLPSSCESHYKTTRRLPSAQEFTGGLFVHTTLSDAQRMYMQNAHKQLLDQPNEVSSSSSQRGESTTEKSTSSSSSGDGGETSASDVDALSYNLEGLSDFSIDKIFDSGGSGSGSDN